MRARLRLPHSTMKEQYYEKIHRRPAGRADPVYSGWLLRRQQGRQLHPQDYSQIIHDARSDEDNEYDMIFGRQVYRIDGYSAEYEADQLNEEIRDIDAPAEPGGRPVHRLCRQHFQHDGAVPLPSWKPAEGKTDEVKAAGSLSEQQSMEHYLRINLVTLPSP